MHVRAFSALCGDAYFSLSHKRWPKL